MAEFPRPPILPRFATLDLLNGTGGAPNVVEPSSGKKDSGWNEGERPPRETFNWLHRITFDWVQYIDSVIDFGVGSHFTEDKTATSGLNFAVGPGKATIGGDEFETVANTILALTDDATNFVWLNVQEDGVGSSFSVLSADESGSPTELDGDNGVISIVPLYRVTTVAGAITVIEDLRSWINIPFTDYDRLNVRNFVGAGKGATRVAFGATEALPDPDLAISNFFLLSPNATPGAIVFQTPDNPGVTDKTDPLFIAIELNNSSQTVTWSSSYNFVGDPSNGAISGANGLSYLAIGFYDPILLEWKMSLVGSSIAFSGNGVARGCLAFGTLNQAAGPASVEFVVLFDSEAFDTDSIHSTSVNTSRLTVPAGVTKIRLSAAVQWQANNDTGHRIMKIKKNGGSGGIDLNRDTYLPIESRPNSGFNTGPHGQNMITGIIETIATDFFELIVVNNAGTINLLADQYWMEMEIIE